MPDFARYYERYSFFAHLAFIKAVLAERSNIRKQALRNRQRDYTRLAGSPERLALHRDLNADLVAAAVAWESHDYGEGYFYQGLGDLGITGLRDTDARVAAMELKRWVAGRSVLEIGCNSGFLSLALAPEAREIVGFDINPHLVGMAERAAEFLKRDNVTFQTAAFEEYQPQRPFEVVLSFANHSTYDGNTRQTIEDYFGRCWELTAPGGHLLFESHPPAHEGNGLDGVMASLEQFYRIEERRVLDYGTFLDRGRTFAVAQRREKGSRA
jgi:cyclopropane fatty-acyl-phospholipid synthase-like methyltransferase